MSDALGTVRDWGITLRLRSIRDVSLAWGPKLRHDSPPCASLRRGVQPEGVGWGWGTNLIQPHAA